MDLIPWMVKPFHDPTRFLIINGGRRVRKTDFLLKFLLTNLTKLPEGAEGWYLAPTYRQAKMVAWRRLLAMIPKHLIVHKSEVELTVELLGGYIIALKGCDNRESLRGGSPWIAVFDEFAYCDPWAWEEVVQPALSDKLGRAAFGSTPRGRETFYRLWKLGMDEAAPEFASYTVTTAEAGTVPMHELERLRASMPLDMFDQEYNAVFLGYVGLMVPEFVPRPYPEGNILPISLWPGFYDRSVFWGSGDYGKGSKTIFHWYAGNQFGSVVQFWEYTGEGQTLPMFVGRDLNTLDQQLLDKRIWRALDKSCWNKDKTSNESIAAQLGRAGVRVLPADADFDASVLALREMCRSDINSNGDPIPPKFMVLEGTCPVSVHELCTVEDSGKVESGEKRVERHRAHDAFDSTRYGIMFRRKAPRMGEPASRGDGGARLSLHDNEEMATSEVSGLPYY